MVHIHIDEQFSPGGETGQINNQKIERAALFTLEYLELQEEADLSIVITDDPGIQDYNKQYRGLDKTTDVLSFLSGEVDPDVGRRYLGDVIISYERAESQAASAGHAPEAELQLLVVHGVLHLGGHDHLQDEDERARMAAAQSEILSSLDLDITPPQL